MEESHLLLRLIYSCSLIIVGFLFSLISFGTERWEPTCEVRGGNHHVVLCVSLLLSIGSIKSMDCSQHGEWPEPCAGGRPTRPLVAGSLDTSQALLCGGRLCWERSVRAAWCSSASRSAGVVVLPSAADHWSACSSLTLRNRTQSCRASKAMHGVFVDPGLRALQGINLSKWGWQRFTLGEMWWWYRVGWSQVHLVFHGQRLRNPPPSLERLKATLLNWSDSFCSLTFLVKVWWIVYNEAVLSE